MQNIDPLDLQRLIDGELERSELQRLLRTAESNPTQWREMAVAFAENQVWQSDFQNTVKTQPCEPKIQSPVVANNAYSEAVPPTKTSVSSDTDNPSATTWWLAMAAGIVVALGMGFYVGNVNSPPGTDLIAESGQTNQRQIEGSQGLDRPFNNEGESLALYRPDYNMQLQDNLGNELLNSEIPLMDEKTARQAGWNLENRFDPIPKETQRRMSQLGYHVKQDVDYYSGRFKDGRQFVVPVQTINFSPGQ